MKTRVRINETLTASEKLELEQAETRGFLIAPNSGRGEFLSKYLETCARNSRNAILLQMRHGASPQIVIQAWRPRDYFELRKHCEALGQIEVCNPYSGLVVIVVGASAAEAIANELASCGAGTYVSALPSDLSTVSVETLGELLLCLPMSLENCAVLQLLQAGKIHGEREVIEEESTMVFRSSGAIASLSTFLRTWHCVEVGLLELFTRGKLEFRLGIRAGKPTILWHCTTALADAALQTTEFSL
jgi:hypothetical protein